MLEKHGGKVRANFTIGAELSRVSVLLSNVAVGHKGFMPYGEAFFITAKKARELGLGRTTDAEKYIKPYMNGRDLNQRPRGIYTIDFHQKDESFVREFFPDAYQYLYGHSRPFRAHNKMRYRRENWWRFGQPSTEMRAALVDLQRYIGTAETARHRMFRFVSKEVAPDQKVRVIADQSAALLSVLSSRVHAGFAIATGGWQGVGNDPVYQHTQTFDPFPFPLAVDPALKPGDPLFAQQERLRELGERLDSFRKDRLAEHSFLTMTGLYNALERLRELENGCTVPPLTDAERDVHQAGLISVLKEIHDDIDRAVLAAYGWEDLIPELVGKPGATLPSPHKTEAQEQAEEELLSRLVALNQERAAEEKRGVVRWLRPDYQIPKLDTKVPKAEAEHVGVLDIELPDTAERPKWPSDGLEQIRLVRDLLSKASAPTLPDAVSAAFDGKNTAKRKGRVGQVLETLVATGLARTGELDGQTRYFLPR